MMRRASARLDIMGRYNTKGIGGGAFQKAKKDAGRRCLLTSFLYNEWAESEFCINSDNGLSPPAAYFWTRWMAKPAISSLR